MNTDPIADLLTRIRNSSGANLSSCTIPYSKIKENILKILVEKSFVTKYEKVENKFPELVVQLEEGKTITLKRISKPGQRIYVKKDDLKRPLLSGLGVRIISTSKGLMTSEEAYKKDLGGEIICEVY
ncbi:30S ribosomal protein S8 [Candidatus Peregrinibacteria bacterium]|jgi:small subunit ribosomal protein S8|nr:30S ribosomal protein S8 [Candidatus Peregrinibacteria bacterium]MBT4147761.1 30S ribosomal protein S8 [Candidatus Peregrinibacteria bacterium]MBT4365928.1 30S ribosomal protein S8 [Candidatus Peregrinibacteria bacterium]MBT4456553.1 30S ribosomal protein S8 [Candidatus Peregrinibacteria bacterium]